MVMVLVELLRETTCKHQHCMFDMFECIVIRVYEREIVESRPWVDDEPTETARRVLRIVHTHDTHEQRILLPVINTHLGVVIMAGCLRGRRAGRTQRTVLTNATDGQSILGQYLCVRSSSVIDLVWCCSRR